MKISFVLTARKVGQKIYSKKETKKKTEKLKTIAKKVRRVSKVQIFRIRVFCPSSPINISQKHKNSTVL